MSEITERVLTGAAFLDKRRPGWDKEIDVDNLHIANGCDCILGQLYGGSYGTGLRKLRLRRPERYGFVAATWSWSWRVIGAETAALTRTWKKVIRARQSP